MIINLQHYGISGTSLKWFMNYLSDRTQFVAVNDVCSSSKAIQMGVTQGSILGPLLLLIYMNDILNSSRHLDFILFADDTTLSLMKTQIRLKWSTTSCIKLIVGLWLIGYLLISRKLSIWSSIFTKKYRLPNIKIAYLWTLPDINTTPIYKSVFESVRNVRLTWYVTPECSQILLQIRA